MSKKPHALGAWVPTSCVWHSLLSSYHAMSGSLPFPETALSLPARHAYSHSASVGRRTGIFASDLTRRTNVMQSCHEMFSMGWSGPLKRERLLCITLSHWRCVTSYFPSQKPLVILTTCCASSSKRPVSVGGLPILNVPGSHQIISMVAPPGRVMVLTSPVFRPAAPCADAVASVAHAVSASAATPRPIIDSFAFMLLIIAHLEEELEAKSRI